MAAFNQASLRLLDFDREAAVLLERLLVDKIWAVPYQVFGSNKVVLRAAFEINLVAILPDDLLSLLAGSGNCQPNEWLPTKKLTVDLFDPTLVPTHALMAYELSGYLNLVEIGGVLGISKRQAHLAAQLGKAMCEAGIDDPYIRLVTAPLAASRWRTHPRFLENGHTGGRQLQPREDAQDDIAAP